MTTPLSPLLITMIDVKIKKLHPKAKCPEYATQGAACFDLCAIDPVTILGGRSVVIPTGLAFELPAQHVMFIYSRSGHGFKHGVRLGNCVGVVDEDYRGEVKVLLRNDTIHTYYVTAGERVAQGLISPLTRFGFSVTEELTATARGDKGFGSTDMPYSDDDVRLLELPVRASNCLRAESIYKLSTLVKWSEHALLKIPNLGRKSLRDIIEALTHRGLELSTDPRAEYAVHRDPEPH